MPPTLSPTTIYQLKVTLKDSHPTIWRRVQVPDNITLSKLHRIIQEVMGWYDSHLHEFTIRGVSYGEANDEASYEIKNEKKVKLNQVVTHPKTKFLYLYDFGDGWEHEVLLEEVLEPKAGTRYPICIGGARACPPEDCGGIFGYADFLEAIRDPQHEEHEETLEWIGGSFDPGAFDLEDVNERLKSIR